jgi:hypothetical protein
LARLNPGGSFEQALPENIRAQDQEVQAVDAQGEAMHKAGVKRRAAGKLVDDLNAQGREGERAMQALDKKNAADDIAEIKKGLELGNDMGGFIPTAEDLKAQAAQGRRMEQQAAGIAQEMMIQNAMGFDTSGLQQQLNIIQQQFAAMKMRTSKQMSGQIGGGQNSALQMYEGDIF